MYKSIYRMLCGLVTAAVVLSVSLSGGPLGLEGIKVSARTNIDLMPRKAPNLEAPLDFFHIAQFGTATTVNAASYVGGSVALESLVSGFGSGLSNSTANAPEDQIVTTLGGSTVAILDALGLSREAPLFFVSPTQINLQIPPGTALGPATLIYTNNVTGQRALSDVEITAVAPGLLSANAAGSGVANGFVLRVRADGSQNYEPIYQINQGQYQAVPIDLGPATDKVYLGLLGTGFRLRSALSAATVTVGGVACEVVYAGPQMQAIGRDQANVLLSRSLAGRGLVNVVMTVDGKTANTVQINIL